MPKVSVIVPSYNHGEFLEVRIKSILNQTFTDFEVFLLDDCSTDNSWAIIEKFANNTKVKFIHRNETNSGSPFLQWQSGIEMASGEYIWIAESDDYAEPDFLKKSIEVMQSDKNIGLTFCPSIWVDFSGNKIESPTHESQSFVEKGDFLIKNDFTKGCLIYNASSVLFKKDLIQNVDFEQIRSYKFTGDWLFWVQLIANTKVSRLSGKLNYFRRHENNVSFKSNRLGLQFSEGYMVVKYIFENHRISFVNKRKINMFWALKVAHNQDMNAEAALKLLPTEVKLWYKLLPIIKIFQNISK